jgi:dTDP-glucose pyrophosphorylase
MDLSKLLIGDKTSLRDAMLKIDSNGFQTVFILNESGHMVASLTDGDIRRAILNGSSIDEQAIGFANHSPVYVNSESDERKARLAMDRLALKCIPVVIDGQIKKVITSHDVHKVANINCAVLIMAGGRGTRLQPLTDSTPKPLVKVGGKPMLEILIERLVSEGLTNIWIAVHYLATQISEYLGDGESYGAKIQYIFEDEPLGTAGAYLRLPDGEKSNPVIVCNADLLNSISFSDFYNHHIESKSVASLGITEVLTNVPFGVVEFEGKQLVNILEKPNLSSWISAGIAIFNKESFEEFKVGQVVNVTDVYSKLLSRKLPVDVYKIPGYWRDLGTNESLQLAHQELLLKGKHDV